jgi:hypothetical protein
MKRIICRLWEKEAFHEGNQHLLERLVMIRIKEAQY